MKSQKDEYLGAKINGCLLVEHIASGDFGEVYRAEVPGQPGSVVVKLLSKEKLAEEKSELFCIDEHLLIKLSHPYLLPILALDLCKGQIDDYHCQPYVITPYAMNGTLRAHILQRSGQPFPLDEVLSVLSPIGQALQYLHQHDIIHRGVQPENIFFDEQGHPLLGGFDLAIVDGARPFWSWYTKFYHAPEQSYGTVNKQGDQFALASTAYEMLTGRHPFSPDFTTELSMSALRKVLSANINLRNSGSAIPKYVEKALVKALSNNPEDRYPDIMSFLLALSTQGNHTVKQTPSTPARTALLEELQANYTKPDIPLISSRQSDNPLPPDFTKSDGRVISADNLQSANLATSTERHTDFVIVTALQEELQAILKKLTSYQQLPPSNEDIRIYYQADLPVTFSNRATGTYRLILLSLLGMGRVHASNAVSDAIRRWHPRYVLLVGIAGGIAGANVKRGDVLISDQIVDYELQKLTETGPQIRPEVHRADPRLIQMARNMGNDWRKLIRKRRPQKGIAERLIGPIATGDKVIAIKEFIEHLQKDWPKLIGIEMEAGGAASAAFQAAQQPGFLMIRGVSDLADEEKDDTWRQYACHSAAAYAITLLQKGPVTSSMPEKADNRNSETTSSMGQIPNLLSFTSIQPKPLELKMPEMGDYFLKQNRQDREYIINIVDTIIDSMSIDGIKNLLRGKLPDPQINRINFRDGSRNVAENIIGNLESRGVVRTRRHYHALGAFLNDLIEDEAVSHDAAIKIVALLFGYTLITDREQIIKLSSQFQVPSPLLTEEVLINHPPSPALLPSTIKITDLQKHFESLYNRHRTLLSVNFLIKGAKAASSVCRIDFDSRGEGTGFLVASDLILTNYHVMNPPGYRGDLNTRARKCEIKFGIIEGVSAGTRFTLHNKWLVEKSPPEDLDFMLLKLNRPVTANDQVWPLSLETYSIQLDEFVNIIQHPNGGSMEVSIRFNQVVAIENNRIYYLADTEEGSSGSPVFDDSWRVVALHHSGGELDNAGKLIRPANVGVPIGAIREQIAVYLNN